MRHTIGMTHCRVLVLCFLQMASSVLSGQQMPTMNTHSPDGRLYCPALPVKLPKEVKRYKDSGILPLDSAVDAVEDALDCYQNSVLAGWSDYSSLPVLSKVVLDFKTVQSTSVGLTATIVLVKIGRTRTATHTTDTTINYVPNSRDLRSKLGNQTINISGPHAWTPCTLSCYRRLPP